MKLVIAVVHTKDADSCTDALVEAGFVCTRFASFGGFLDRDNATLMIGVDDPLVEQVFDVLRRTARRRNETLTTGNAMGGVGAGAVVMPVPMDVEVGGATVFVVDVERFEKL